MEFQPEWIEALVGGAMIGFAAAGLLLINGRIAGISGILSNAVRGTSGVWRWAFLIGLVAAPLWTPIFGLPYAIAHHQGGLVQIAVAGVLVGIGTQMGSGCTSGHGVCGLANLSFRSFTATAIFMGVAIITVFILRHAIPGVVGG
jgi:uncharacterized membrane protein YedE/YeeE